MEPRLKKLLKELEDISTERCFVNATNSYVSSLWVSLNTVKKLLKKHWPTEAVAKEEK